MMSSAGWRASLPGLLAVLAACNAPVPIDDGGGGGGGGSSIVVDSTSPVANGVGTPFSLPVYAYTTPALQASSVTVTSAALATDVDGLDVPRKVLLINGNKVQMVASMLPGTTYRATLGMDLRSVNGGLLAAPFIWKFTTRPFVPFVLDSGNTSFFGHLSMARDTLGGLHAVYADSVHGDLFYAECAGTCVSSSSWTVVALDTVGTVGSSSAIAVDPAMRVHIVYRNDNPPARLLYATCVSPCTDRLQFQFATVDSSSGGIGIAPAIAVDPNGVVHTTYYDNFNSYLRYARCLALCGLNTNWLQGTIDGGPFVGNSSAIVLDGATRHVVYADSGGSNLKYATCTTVCVGAGEWQLNPITVADGGTHPSLALGPNHSLMVSYFASSTGNLKFAQCLSACITIDNWQSVVLSTTGIVGRYSSIVVDALGRAQLVFADDNLDQLSYGTCASNCTTSSRWRYSVVESNVGLVTTPVSVQSKDGLQVMFLGWSGSVVRFAQ